MNTLIEQERGRPFRLQQSEYRIWKLSSLLTITVAMIFLMLPQVSLALFGFGEEPSPTTGNTSEVPQDYKGKQMPSGWTTDPKILAAGKAIYEGTLDPKINCASCHGEDGEPTRKGRGAAKFSDPAEANKPDDFLFWRISEGVPRSKMNGWKKKLTEEQRWQVIAYIRTLMKS